MDAITAWEALLSPEHVLADEKNLAAVQTTTFATEQRVLAVIRPADRSQIQACVKIANQYHIPIYPTSCGKNWGLGSRVPVRDKSVVMDLSRLDRIVEYNEKLAYITVEPGVTFRQVYEYLRDIESNLFVSVIGGSPNASLIGNALERGDGSGPYGERVSHACGFEVVLPTGDFIRTGFGRFANATTTHLSRFGVGPALDGIFSQSNLGIVTQMTIWLMPMPKYYQSFTCVLTDNLRLDAFIDLIQGLVLQGTIKENCFNFWNCYKFLAREGQYPWQFLDRVASDLPNRQTSFSLLDLKKAEPWFCSGDIYGASQEQILAERNIIETALAGRVDRIIFADVVSGRDRAKSNLGVPTDANIKSTYWRKKMTIPTDLDPDRDACGVMWLCPLFPFDGQQIVDALATIESIIKSARFEPNIALLCATGRIIKMFIAIMYDRAEPHADRRAMACHDRLLQFLIDRGYYPYRLGIQSMNSLPPARDDYAKLLDTLKQGLDPNQILSPGRYDFRTDLNLSNHKNIGNSII